MDYYERAIAASLLPEQQVLSKLGQLNVLIADSELFSVPVLVTEIENLLTQLPPSATAIDARLGLVRNLMKLKQDYPDIEDLEVENADSIQHLATAISEASTICDRRR